MRILVFNTFRRHLGGVETYLSGLLPALVAAGHDVALVHEHDGPEGRRPIFDGTDLALGSGTGDERRETIVRRVREWGPDVVFKHTAARDRALIESLASLAPVVFFVHDYAGSCISGLKTWQSVPAPCNRPLGPMCLAHYYPHRCGGLHPGTMWTQWTLQRIRQKALRSYEAVMVASAHMREEMLRQGVSVNRLHAPDYYCAAADDRLGLEPTPPVSRSLGSEARLLFVGRVDRLKGLNMLLEALPAVARDGGRPVRLVVAGDGPALPAVRLQAESLPSGVAVDFLGWCEHGALSEQWARAELLVVPSVWPEPFGQVGPEAGAWGVPAVAFPVGGTRSWLSDGENGRVARTEHPAPGPLAEAIVHCMADEQRWNAMRRRAWVLAGRFRLESHMEALMRVLEGITRPRVSPSVRRLTPPPSPAWHGTGK